MYASGTRTFAAGALVALALGAAAVGCGGSSHHGGGGSFTGNNSNPSPSPSPSPTPGGTADYDVTRFTFSPTTITTGTTVSVNETITNFSSTDRTPALVYQVVVSNQPINRTSIMSGTPL